MPRSSPSQKAQKKLMKLTKLAQRKAHQSKLNVDGDAELLVELARSAKLIKSQLKKKLKMKKSKKTTSHSPKSPASDQDYDALIKSMS